MHLMALLMALMSYETTEGERTVYVANGAGGLHTLEFTTPYHGTLRRNLRFPTDALTFNGQFGSANCTKVRVQRRVRLYCHRNRNVRRQA